MARKKKGEAHGGGHGWYVTFADLMALLMAFFVVVAASSTQDKEKMATAMGSIREAFGMQTKNAAGGGIMEIDGVPVRSFAKNVKLADPSESTQTPGPIEEDEDTAPLRKGRDFKFASAAASLRQALQEMPEISEISQNILIEEHPDGLAIQIADQDGRSMFPEGSAEPYERVRLALQTLAAPLRSLPQRISVTGYTAESQAGAAAGFGPWEISAERANAVRRILAENGVQEDRFHSVIGRGDTEPLYPDNPYLPANRRVSIKLMAEPPPVPADVRL